MKIIYEVTVNPNKLDPTHLDEVWRLDGAYHREHGPAYIVRNADNQVITEHWFRKGEHYREDGPAIVHNDPQDSFFGHVEEDDWYPRRSDHPSRIVKINGIVTTEEWYSSGHTLHRLDGPALIARDRETGEITKQEYYRNGRKVKPPSDAPKLGM